MSKALLKPDVIAAIATPHGQGGIGVADSPGLTFPYWHKL